MATALGEHRGSMTYRCTELSLTALLSLTCSLSLGCDAREKTVGQETEGGTESDSGTDTQNCGGVLPCGTNASDSDSDSDSSAGETEGGGTEDCSVFEDAPACSAEGCVWRETSTVSAGDPTCEVGDGDGECMDPDPTGPDEGCGLSPCPGTDTAHWTQEIEEGTWETFSSNDCFEGSPVGFTLCQYAGDDPAACDCLCSGAQTALPSGFETTLGASGCADMTAYGASPDGSIGLVLSTGPDFNPVADAVAAGETTTTTHDVSEFPRLSVLVGTNVTYLECNDAIDKSAFSIDQEWLATAGTVEIEVIPEMDAPKFDTQGFATVTITGLEVTLGGVTEALDTVIFEDIAVGWLPG